MAEEPPAYKERNKKTDTPPAYDEAKGLKDGPKDGSATATTTTAPPKERRPDGPAPEGDGILSSPLKRMMYIGVILLLYYILSFWKPVYWMTSAASYCKFQCNTYPDASSSVNVGSSSISIGGGFGLSGCYESIDPACEDTCDAGCDICNDQDICKDALDLLYESMYSTSSRESRLASFSMIVLGFIFGAIGVVIGYFAVKKGKTLFSQISSVTLGLGSLLSILGAIIFLATWHDNIDFEETLAAAQIQVFIEYLLPGIIGIILAVDIFTYASIFNDSKKRMFALSIPFAILGFVSGILFAYIINWEPDPPSNIGYEFPLYDQLACIAAGYFIISLMSIGRILIFGEFVNVNPAQVIMIKFIITILLFIGGIITAVGYWAMIDAIFDCDYNILYNTTTCEGVAYLYHINGDVVGPLYAATIDVNYKGQFKCYYVSYSFFILLITALNVYDMDIIGNYKKVRMAQQAADAAT